MNQQRIRVETVGAEAVPVVVIDDFSPDPDALVEEAVRLSYQPLGAFYPGPRAPVGAAYFKGLNGVIAAVAKQVFGAADRIACDRALYSISTASPGDLSLAQRIPHVDDTEPGKLAIVHYLSRADLGGTAFYRHRSTGFERITPDRHRAYLDALNADFAAHGEPPPGYIDGDTALFEQTAAVRPAFNRALIYPGNLLHCACLAGQTLSSDPRVGRLTVASFLTAR
ncbi:MAG: hypothetical protein EON88_15205 [Brevundimonas sp.]|nr:MAG: hypothetical protein EON88_15205 [Brevundimonas sp.]